MPATTLKVAGIELFCGGRTIARDADEEIVALDSRRGRYRRLLLHDDRLVGAILLGDLRDARALRTLLATGARVPEALLEPSPAGAETPARHDADPATTVCSCMAVSHGEIAAAIDGLSLNSVEDIGSHTRAGTGCGTCRADLDALLAARRQPGGIHRDREARRFNIGANTGEPADIR